MSEAKPKRRPRATGAASVERIERRTIWEQAYAILRAQILDGRLTPGTLLNLRDLAEQLSVSVTPIRDAVLRLVAEGLIEDDGSHEFRVTQLSEEEIKQTLDLRILLEVYALEQSAPKLTEADFERLEELLTAAEELLEEPGGETGRRYTELGREFHQLLVEAADNRPLLDLHERLHPQAFLVIERSFHGFPHDRNREDHLEHRKIFAALRQREYVAARQLLEEHLKHVRAYTLGGYHNL
jgi:DNA-binding GntR family transcriptional regulator